MKLESEKKQLHVSLEDVENQLTKAELLRQSLEGEYERMKLAINDKEAENRLLSCRAENLTTQIDEVEKKNRSLTAVVDRLNLTLAASEQQESVHKNQVAIHNV